MQDENLPDPERVFRGYFNALAAHFPFDSQTQM